ncbi:MAG: prepilin peptidase [Candidatus Paceibacterota bacterium]
MIFSWPIAIVVFLLGSSVGSFLNVLVYRTMRGEDWVKGRSHCESCHRPITWYENIPIVSYLWLRGRCSHCRKSIDPIHPTLELLTGTLFLWWYVDGWSLFTAEAWLLPILQPLFWLLVGIIAITIIIADFKEKIIPRQSVAVLTILTLCYRFVLIMTGEMQLVDLGWSLLWSLILVLAFFFLWWSTRGKSFGFGDVQLALPLGLLLGSWQRIIIGIWLAFLIGAVVGLTLVFFKKKKFRQAIPFGPFLLLGTALSLRWGYQIWESYLKLISG